jgi:hypothetical protein
MTVARSRARLTPSSITVEQLQLVRQRIAFSIGFPQISPLLASFLEEAEAGYLGADR